MTLTSLHLKDKYRKLLRYIYIKVPKSKVVICSSFSCVRIFRFTEPFFFCENPACDLPGPASVAKSYSISKPAVVRLALNGHLIDFLRKSGNIGTFPAKLK